MLGTKVVDVNGEVERRLDKICLKYILWFIAIFNLIPTILSFIVVEKYTLSTVLIVMSWNVWVIISFFITTRTRRHDVSPTEGFLLLPMSLPIVIFMSTAVFILKKKYPNSDDPNEILKFERTRKIKNFL